VVLGKLTRENAESEASFEGLAEDDQIPHGSYSHTLALTRDQEGDATAWVKIIDPKKIVEE
jgi:hypothetical protein